MDGSRLKVAQSLLNKILAQSEEKGALTAVRYDFEAVAAAPAA